MVNCYVSLFSKQHRQRYIADGSTQPQPFGGAAASGTFSTTRLPPDGMTKSFKLDQYGYAHVWELHHLHEYPEDTPSSVPASAACGTLTASIGSSTIKPLKYNVSGDNLESNGYVVSGHMDPGLKVSSCPHQTSLYGHHVGEPLYPDRPDPMAECQHLDLGNSGPEIPGGHCENHMIST